MRKVKLVITFILVGTLLSGCGCQHQWKDATCQAPKTCELCGATEGEVVEHIWSEATCTNPKTCEVCGSTDGEALPHEWVAATCTEAKTCFTCKLTEGEANGHKFESATCTTAETCSVCGETRGEPLGHILVETAQTREATCTQTGIVEGVCTRCNKTLSEEIPMLDHTPGEWTISVPATYDNSGTKEVKCTVCETSLDEESYELTPEEKEAWYKDACEQIPYKDIARTPDEYVGKRIKITGEVGIVWQEASAQGEYSVYLVYTKSSYGFYMEDPFFVLVDNYESNSRILQGDVITFYGEADGLYDEFGEKQPKLITTYYEIKS